MSPGHIPEAGQQFAGTREHPALEDTGTQDTHTGGRKDDASTHAQSVNTHGGTLQRPWAWRLSHPERPHCPVGCHEVCDQAGPQQPGLGFSRAGGCGRNESGLEAGRPGWSCRHVCVVCMPVHVCMRIHTCTYMYVCMPARMCIDARMRACLCTCVYTCERLCTCACLHVYACTCTFMSVYVCMPVCAHTCMHACMSVHVSMHVNAHMRVQCACEYMHTCVPAPACSCPCVRACMHTHVHVCASGHTYICVHALHRCVHI